MKNFKRILALVMVFCTVAAWMIPGVTAAETPASLTVNFKNDFDTAGIAANTYLNGSSSTGAIKTLLDLYPATIKWAPLVDSEGVSAKSNSTYTARAVSNSKYFQLRTNSNTEVGRQPLVFTAPGTGDYKLSLTFAVAATAAVRAEYAGAFIIESPETPYTRYTIPGPTSALAQAKVEIDVDATNEDGSYKYNGGTFTSEGTVALESGKEYIIIFYSYKENGSTTPAYADFSQFALTPVVKTDYSVTYHANYEGADPATVADSENVTQVTDSEKTITVDEVPFSRGGSYAIAGWATSADGEVVYQAGDTITLTNDDPDLDLYAVWKEVWDPANNTDLTVNFKNDFDTAGVPASGYLVTAANANLLDAAYTAGTIDWTVVRASETNQMSYNATNNGGRYRSKFLEVLNSGQQSSYPYAGVPLKFKAPGTGEYKLSFTYGKAYSGDNGGELIGAYIQALPEGGRITRYTSFTPYGSQVQLYAAVENPGASGTGTSTGTVMLEGGEEYVIVFFGYDSDYTTPMYANFETFTLTEVKPEAYIGSTTYATVEKAVAAAVSGNTIMLNTDAAADDVSLTDGVTLDLNGKTLTAAAFAGVLADTADGTGRLAVAKGSAVVESPDGQIAMWDNTTGAEGYRVFNYTFKSLETTGTNNQDLSVNFIAAYENYANSTATQIVNGYTLYETGKTINAAYDKGTNNWGIACGHRMGLNFAQLMSNGLKVVGRNLGADQSPAARVGAVGLKITAPGSGWYEPSVCYAARPGSDVAEDLYMYILPLPVEDYWTATDSNGNLQMSSGYELNGLFSETPTVSDVSATKVLSTKVRDAEMTGTVAARVAVGESYLFEAGKEYMVILAVDSEIYATPGAEVISMTFTCVQSDTTFWSYMEFANEAAYSLVAASDLKAGFKMSTDGEYFESFELDAATMAAWAAAEIADAESDYGFYIRVHGFESLTESTTVTCIPYITSSGKTVEAATKTYYYAVEVAE